MNHTSKARTPRRARLFSEVTRAIGRRPHQRVCPLPLAFAAIAIPFLAAWATAAPAGTGVDTSREAGSAPGLPKSAGTTPDPWAILDRARRQPEAPGQPGASGTSGAYIDLYAPLEPWEEGLVSRQGYVSVGR